MKILIYNPANNSVRVLADSSVARAGQPWFMPEEGGQWSARLAHAWRISRLGKAIRAEFASRYVDAHTTLWLPEAATPLPEANYMDGAAVVGAWLPLQAPIPPELAQAIHRLSQLSTFKMGDIIAIQTSESKLLHINQHIELECNNTPVGAFNIK